MQHIDEMQTRAYPLDNFTVCRNQHPFDVSAHTSPLVGTNYIRLTSPKAERNVNQALFSHKPLKQVSLSYLSFGEEVTISSPKPSTYYHLQLILNGQSQVISSNNSFTATKNTAAIINPFHPLTLTYSPDCEKLILRVERKKLEETLAGIIGYMPQKKIEFSQTIPTDSGAGASLAELVHYISREINSPSSIFALTGNLSTSLEDMLVLCLLYSIPNNYTHVIMQNATTRSPENIRKIEAFIEENLDEEISLDDLVRVSGVSKRVLYKRFQEYKQVSPMVFLRTRRLEQIHSELLASAQGAPSITDIAMKYGFHHLGRFSSEYKKRFGELPSQTLKTLR